MLNDIEESNKKYKPSKCRFIGCTSRSIPLCHSNQGCSAIDNNTNNYIENEDSYTGPKILDTCGYARDRGDHFHYVKILKSCDCSPRPPKPCPPPKPSPTPPPSPPRCPFPTPNLNCPGFPRDGACVPVALGFKPKQDVQTKIEKLANNTQVPTVLGATFWEIARRFLNGQESDTPIEANLYEILNQLSPEALDICKCALNVIDAIPSSQRNKLLSPDIKPTTALTVDNLVNLLADEIVRVAGLNIMDDENGLTDPRPGRVRRPRGTPEFPGEPFPTIYYINDIRTLQGIRAAGGGEPTSEEAERVCTVNQQNQQVCTILTENCPGNSTLPPNPVCLLVQQVLPGDLVKLQGANYFTTDAKVIITSKFQPSLKRVVPTVVFGDVDTPVRDEQGNLIDDTRVKDKILFAIPEDLPDGIYKIQVEVQNTNPEAGPVKTYTSDEEYLRVLPPPNTNYQILAEQLICVEETSGPGSDEVALNFFTSLLVLNPDTGNIDLTPLVSQEFRFEGVDSGEPPRTINYAPVQANNLVGVNITIQGYEVDNEDFYKEKIREFEAAFKAGLESVWASLASSLTTAIGGLIAVLAGAAAAVAGPIIAAAATVIGAVVALFYALWAPADPIMEDIIGLSLVQLATLTDNATPMPPQVQFTTPQEIRVVVDSLSKNVEFRQLRGYISEDEDSLYQIPFRYSRI